MQRECKSVRSVYGKTLAEIGRENKNVVVLDADLSCSTQTQIFAKEFPDRFFNAGIAEQDLMTTAAGLACSGKTGFVSTFAMFASGRAWEQIRNTICYSNLNVKFQGIYNKGLEWEGKGYNNKGFIKLELKNGKGKGKEYNYFNGKLEFEGEQWNGKRKEYLYEILICNRNC